jgi:hypothetical protein
MDGKHMMNKNNKMNAMPKMEDEMEDKMEGEKEDSREKFDDENTDRAYDVAVSLSEAIFYDPEHLNGLMSAVQKSSDPNQVVGTALGQVLLVAYNKANQAELNIDDKVWAADEGVLDTLINEAAEFLGETGVRVDPGAVREVAVQVLQKSPQPEQQQPAQQPMGAMPQ